ncbi:MAG: DegT/DnrJ/EryC1/StrS family aminotransferase [Candidatus Omnitrophica bacterium]|nr:DegT/DnrJ/EryC1/StrS family aminotransferase [Candidatus Omnitrophota bacterium]
MTYKIPFSGRAIDYTEDEIQTVVTAMKTADPLTQGKYLKEFEQKFAEYIGSPKCFAMCNATAALEICAQLGQFKPGDEVVVPAHTFTSSVYPFVKKGVTPVWADIDLKTRVVTAETIERCLSPKTKAIIVVHLYGYVADMPSIMALAKKHNLLVIEDAAQSIGGSINGKQSGTFADLAVFSLHSHKNITTLGEGGVLAVNNEKFVNIIPQLRHNGHCAFSFERQDYWIPAMGNVDMPQLNGEPVWPNNYCLGEVECALGTKLLQRLDPINAQKRRRAISLIDALKSYSELEFHREDSVRHNYHLLAGRITHGKRDDFIRKMATEKSVQCVVQYYPLYRYDFYKKLKLDKANCPNTDLFFDNMVSFPFQHRLTDQEFLYLQEAIKDVLNELRK